MALLLLLLRLLGAVLRRNLALLLSAAEVSSSHFDARARGAPAPVGRARGPPPRRETRRKAHLRVGALGSDAIGRAVAEKLARFWRRSARRAWRHSWVACAEESIRAPLFLLLRRLPCAHACLRA